ncbi:MAG: glutamine cyclotransferase, partial [Parabacteroides sp.]
MNRLIYLALSIALISCGQKGTNEAAAAADTASAPASTAPVFDGDSAYSYVSRQVAFGPRVPNTDAHKSCSKYLALEMKRFGAKVYQQETALTAYNGTQLQVCNIIGSFNPENSKRILL